MAQKANHPYQLLTTVKKYGGHELLLILIVMLFTHTLEAQKTTDTVKSFKKNTVYLEGFILIYNITYERVLIKKDKFYWTGGLGISYFGKLGFIYIKTHGMYSLDNILNNLKLDLGLNLFTALLYFPYDPNRNWDINPPANQLETAFFHPALLPILNIGVRYHNLQQGGFFMKIAYSPAVNLNDWSIAHFPSLGLGYSF